MPTIFERTVFRNSTNAAHFDPHTFTMCVTELTDEELLYSAIHELAHWIQHISYTFGGFLNALSHLRDFLGLHILSKYNAYVKHEPSEWLKFSPFLPNNDRFYHFILDADVIDKELLCWQVAWRDLLICEKLILRLSDYHALASADEALMRAESLIPRCLGRIHNAAVDLLRYTKSPAAIDFEKDGLYLNLRLKNFGSAVHAGVELDTIDIIEGMPIVYEVLLKLQRGQDADARKRLNDISNTHYVRAIAIFMEIIGLSVQSSNLKRLAEMFMTIAEISLNPPLPPYGIIGELELDWNKIYPPIRFVQLCQIAKHVSGYSIGGPHWDWLTDWTARLLALYSVEGGTSSRLNRDRDGYLPSGISLPFLNLLAEEDTQMREILKSKEKCYQPALAKEFEHITNKCTGLHLYAMLRHAHVLAMNWHRIESPWLIPYERNRTTKHNFFPPVLVRGNGFVHTMSSKFVSYIIDYNLSTYPLHDTLWAVSPPAIYLPEVTGLTPNKRREMVHPQLRDLLHWQHLL